MFTNADSWIGHAVTLLVVVFGGGRAYGVLDSRNKDMEKRLNAMEEGMVDHDNQPLFITYPAHDKMMEHCRELQTMQYESLKSAINKLDEKLEKLSDKVTK